MDHGEVPETALTWTKEEWKDIAPTALTHVAARLDNSVSAYGPRQLKDLARKSQAVVKKKILGRLQYIPPDQKVIDGQLP